MADLTQKTALATVEIALKNTILLALGQRIAPSGQSAFADIPTLKTLPSAGIRTDELAFVTTKGLTYQFSRTSMAADDGNLVIAPNDATTAGRWLQTTSNVKSGYAKQVRVHVGTDTFTGMLMKGYSVRPSIHILFDTLTPFSRSLSKGALYQYAARWKVRCIGSNLRPQAQAAEGSDVPSETDPGAHQIMGDVINTVAGSNLNVPAVVYCEIEKGDMVETPEEGRLVVDEITVVAFYTVQTPDTDAVTIDPLSGLYVQRALLGGGTSYDANNLVTSGYTIPTGTGFTKTPVAGTAKINGAAVSSSPGANTFSANSDTYRDLHSDGTFSYTAVGNGKPAPAIVYSGAAGNTMRVGVTVTDGNGVIWDQMIAPTLVNFQAVDIVPAAGIKVSSIAVTPTTATLTTGHTQKFTATATYTDGRTADISTVVTWVSSNQSAAIIDYSGLATWVATGTSTISCSYDGLAGGNTATLTCS